MLNKCLRSSAVFSLHLDIMTTKASPKIKECPSPKFPVRIPPPPKYKGQNLSYE